MRLVESKAKLTPLDHKGEAVKAELCGAVFAACLKKYSEQHGRIQVNSGTNLLTAKLFLVQFSGRAMAFRLFSQTRLEKSKAAHNVRIGGGSLDHRISLTSSLVEPDQKI